MSRMFAKSSQISYKTDVLFFFFFPPLLPTGKEEFVQ